MLSWDKPYESYFFFFHGLKTEMNTVVMSTIHLCLKNPQLLKVE